MKTKNHFSLLPAAVALAAITFSLAVRAQAQTESVLYSFAGGFAGLTPLPKPDRMNYWNRDGSHLR